MHRDSCGRSRQSNEFLRCPIFVVLVGGEPPREWRAGPATAPNKSRDVAATGVEPHPVQDRALHGPPRRSHLLPPLPLFRSSLRLRFLTFQKNWVAAFELSVSSVTLIMVFAIQHTQGREQAATQRKLDELIRVSPGANESLMMLEESPREFMLDVEDEQRGVRSNSPDIEGE